jgi:hypothetical protein
VAAIVLLAVVSGACTLGVTDDTVSGNIDDPATLDRLGVSEPDAVWRRNVAGIEVLGTSGRADSAELELIGGAIQEVPRGFLDGIGLRYLVRTSSLDDVALHPATAAFARGPDIFLLDRTFAEPRAGATRLGLARVMVHEMAHIAQFDTLAPDYIAAVLDGTVDITDTGAGSTLVADFAAAVGWRNDSGDPFRPAWRLPGSAFGTTEYGTTSPEEDMAESLAMIAIGRSELISTSRVRWIEQWLGIRADNIGTGKPYAPAGSFEVFFRDPLYDEEEVAAQRAAHIEPIYFELAPDQPDPERLARNVSGELRRRSLVGQLQPTDDPRLPRYSGLFSRTDGVRFWVELWDFRESTGFRSAPDAPVLSYVMLW